MLTSVKFTELCAFDSESSEKKILSSKCVFLFRSSNVTDRWLCLSPPQHGPHDCLPQRLFVTSLFRWEFMFVRHYVRVWFTSGTIVGFGSVQSVVAVRFWARIQTN